MYHIYIYTIYIYTHIYVHYYVISLRIDLKALNRSSAVPVIAARPGPLDSDRGCVRKRPCGSLASWGYPLVIDLGWMENALCLPDGSHIAMMSICIYILLSCSSRSLDFQLSVSFRIVTLYQCTKQHVPELSSISSE